MSDNVQLAQELVDARAFVASPEYTDRVNRIAEIEAEAATLKGVIAAADARLARAAVAVADIGNAEAYEAGFAAALAKVAADAEAARVAAEAEAAAAAAEAAAQAELFPVEAVVEAPAEAAVAEEFPLVIVE